MNHAHRIANRTMAAMAAILMLLGVGTASAQFSVRPLNCPSVTVRNNHAACAAQVRFTTNPPGVWPVAVIPAGGSILLPVPAAGVVVTGITSAGGNFYGFNSPSPGPGVGCGPLDWWIAHVSLTPALACCFDICADPCNCTITLNPSAVPPACNP